MILEMYSLISVYYYNYDYDYYYYYQHHRHYLNTSMLVDSYELNSIHFRMTLCNPNVLLSEVELYIIVDKSNWSDDVWVKSMEPQEIWVPKLSSFIIVQKPI